MFIYVHKKEVLVSVVPKYKMFLLSRCEDNWLSVLPGLLFPCIICPLFPFWICLGLNTSASPHSSSMAYNFLCLVASFHSEIKNFQKLFLLLFTIKQIKLVLSLMIISCSGHLSRERVRPFQLAATFSGSPSTFGHCESSRLCLLGTKHWCSVEDMRCLGKPS